MKNRPLPKKLSRRRFLKRTAAAAGALALPWFIPARALGRDGAVAPSERIVLGGIGLGPRGQYDLSVMLPEKDVQFVAICDVQRTRREQVKKIADDHYGNRDCVMYQDFFELLGRPDIDAVLIATGDHWHAQAALLAAKAGKDVYCEKPCGMTIGQIQALSDGIHRYGRVFQAGTQRRSIKNFQYAIHLAHSGRLGRLRTLHASVYVPQKNYAWLAAEPEPAPEECDWNRWVGPAPWRPYNHHYVSGGWRGHHDFEAGGNFLDWGAHTLDLCQWANQADHTMPIEYEATPDSIIARYANGVKIICDFLPTPFGNRDPQYRTSTGTCPVRFEGDEGWVETGDDAEVVLSESLARERRKPFGGTGLSSAGHGRNFFDCVKSRAMPVCNQDIMRRSHITCFAAELSWQLGRKLTLDPAKEEFVGDEEANRMRSRATREPWSFYI
ncbi:MAG: Gfo/Idh/MocA family protein [Limisphaerales bacterium]